MAEDDDSALEDFILIIVLAKEDTIEYYVVPSFPVFGAKLTEVKLQWESCEGEIMVFDGFARSCEALEHPLPAIEALLDVSLSMASWSTSWLASSLSGTLF